MARFYSLPKLRRIVGEEDTSNDVTNTRLREAGETSQAKFNRATANITVTITEIERELVNQGAVAYWYFRENGDEAGVITYEKDLKEYVLNTFGRPEFITRGAL